MAYRANNIAKTTRLAAVIAFIITAASSQDEDDKPLDFDALAPENEKLAGPETFAESLARSSRWA